jgi:exopolysaccharide production protein ExoY
MHLWHALGVSLHPESIFASRAGLYRFVTNYDRQVVRGPNLIIGMSYLALYQVRVALQHFPSFTFWADHSVFAWSSMMKYAARLSNLQVKSRSGPVVQPPIGGMIKRGFDILGAAAGLVVLSPLLVMLALLVKLSDGGSILFGHSRIGRNGSVFQCLKFRTMAENGHEVLAEHFAKNPLARTEWEATRKLQDDPRVTRVGAVLRKLSLDELPQLINILRGDMSIVGPRPVVRDELEMYGNAAVYYLQSRPGLTGLWQVSGRNDVSYTSRVAFDRHYVENWSLAFDLLIIIKTFPAVVSSRGSY